jgi:hypothetical protein
MSLDVYLLRTQPTRIYQANITHNLNVMAKEAGAYEVLWRPEELGMTKAGELVPMLRAALERLVADPERYRKYNPENGWGSYDGLVKFIYEYLCACETHPDADIEVSR